LSGRAKRVQEVEIAVEIVHVASYYENNGRSRSAKLLRQLLE
jgi:hypothetical protein